MSFYTDIYDFDQTVEVFVWEGQLPFFPRQTALSIQALHLIFTGISTSITYALI